MRAAPASSASRRSCARCLNATACDPAEALYVGDEVRDAEAAQAVGIAFAAVSWGFATPEALRRQAPDRLFASVADIAPAFGASARV